MRRAWPDAQLEIVGQKQIVALAERRFYADATRSIEAAGLAPFFVDGGELPPEWCAYFAGFEFIVSYLPDPDGMFAVNLDRAGAREVAQGPLNITGHAHAALQLALPLQQFGITCTNPAAELFPNAEDNAFASRFLAQTSGRVVALHPGSGGRAKNWPIDGWIAVARSLLSSDAKIHLLIVGGEADADQLRAMSRALPARTSVAEHLPLPQLAAVLAQCSAFVGHDSGISHLAAAVGTPTLLLFGPTDPRIWAPANANARVLRAPDGEMTRLPVAQVERAVYELMRIGINT